MNVWGKEAHVVFFYDWIYFEVNASEKGLCTQQKHIKLYSLNGYFSKYIIVNALRAIHSTETTWRT